MDFEKVLRKFVRFPWEVWDGRENWEDKKVGQTVASSCFAKEFFKSPPADEKERLYVLQSIAHVMVLALLTQRGGEIDKRNKFHTLSAEEKKFLFRILAINAVEDEAVLQIVKKEAMVAKLASYVAAAYAFTTWTKPFVLDFDRMDAIAYHAAHVGASDEEKNLRTAGLLIVTGLGSPTKTNEPSYALLHKILATRAAAGRMNVFYDTPKGDMLLAMREGLLPTREEVVRVYLKAFPPHTMMQNFLVGFGVHMPFIDASEDR